MCCRGNYVYIGKEFCLVSDVGIFLQVPEFIYNYFFFRYENFASSNENFVLLVENSTMIWCQILSNGNNIVLFIGIHINFIPYVCMLILLQNLKPVCSRLLLNIFGVHFIP